MAQGDSVGRDLDKRTRDLSQQRIQPGGGLAAQQIAQNQLQAIQNEQRNNLTQARVQAQADAQAQQIAVQAAQIGTMESGPAVQTLKRYGLTRPRVIRTQSRDIKVAPPNITINNTTNNTTTTGVGPTPGRELAFKQPQIAFQQSQQSTNKFKLWLSGLLLSQKEANARRERDFDKRESTLVRSSNKMLKRIELAGRDIAENLDPKVIGTTVGNQLRILFMIFALQFLSKHWGKVLNGIDVVAELFKKGLNYFGATGERNGRQALFYKDLMTFFGATQKDKNLFDVFTRLGNEFIEHLKMSLDHALSLRGDAMKAIKFPDIDLNNLGLTLSNISGYVSNILTAMMDPKKGMANSIKSTVNNTMTAVKRDSDKEKISFDDEVKKSGLKDTSYGDYAAEKRQALTQNALDGAGNLKNNTWASISQGRDIVQAFNNSENGDIDIARLGGGLQRLQDTADRKGYVTLDPSTLNSLFGDKLSPLIRSGEITAVPMKYVQVEKTKADYADENADPDKAALEGGLKGWALDQVPGAGIVNALEQGKKYKLIGSIRGYMQTTALGGAAIGASEAAFKRKFWSDKNTLKLVPASDPRPGIALDGRVERIMYQVKPQALSRLASILTKSDEFTKIDTGSEAFMKALEKHLTDRAGGRVKSRDFNITEGYQIVHDLEAREEYYKKERQNSPFMQHVGLIGHNSKKAANSAYQTMGRAISTIGDIITGVSGGSSRTDIDNWLWGGNAPKEYNPADKAHMDTRVVTVSVPIHNMNNSDGQMSITVNKLLAQSVRTIFTEIYETVPDFKIDPATTGGYNYRPVKLLRGHSNRLSSHALGGAIDINTDINPLGDTNTQDTTTHFGTEKHPVVQIFIRHSWEWGGKYSGNKDNMHFQYAGRTGVISETQSAPQTYSYSVGETVSEPQVSAPTSGQFHAVSGADYQAPVIQPTGQASFLDWKESEGTGKGKRFNNPGNKTKVDSKFGSGVVKEGETEWTTYSSLEDGFAGNADLIIRYLKGEVGPLKKNPTVREFISSWCPPSGPNGESPEATAQYIQDVAEWSGFGTDNPIPLTPDSVLTMNACLARHDSGTVNKKALLEGTSKAWNLYLKDSGGETDDNNLGIKAGNLFKNAARYIESTQLFDDASLENEEAELRHKNNWDTVNKMGFNRDTAKIYRDSYFMQVYGDDATTDSIAAEWDRDPDKRARDEKYFKLYSTAEELWGRFGSEDESDRLQVLGPFATKDEFRKYFSTLSAQDQDMIVRRADRWTEGRHKTLVNLDDYEKDLYKGVSGAGYGTRGTALLTGDAMNEYRKLMQTGQYDKAWDLIEKYGNSAYEGGKEDYKRKAGEFHKEIKAYNLHGQDYRRIKLELESAKKDLKDAQEKNTSVHRWWKVWKSDKEKEAASAAVTAAQENVDALTQKASEYEKIDNSVESLQGLDPKVVDDFDSATSEKLGIKKRLEEIEKEKRDFRFATDEEFEEQKRKWNEETEKLQKELEESENRIRELIGNDQEKLLDIHKKRMEKFLSESGHRVEDAENEYTKLIESGKTHQEIMAEIEDKYDKEVIDYLKDFGEVIIKEKERVEEEARQQLRQTAAKLAGVDPDSIDWDDKYFQGDFSVGQLARRAKLKALADKGLPLLGLRPDEIPEGYDLNGDYNYYLPKDQAKWAEKPYYMDAEGNKVLDPEFGKRLASVVYMPAFDMVLFQNGIRDITTNLVTLNKTMELQVKTTGVVADNTYNFLYYNPSSNPTPPPQSSPQVEPKTK